MTRYSNISRLHIQMMSYRVNWDIPHTFQDYTYKPYKSILLRILHTFQLSVYFIHKSIYVYMTCSLNREIYTYHSCTYNSETSTCSFNVFTNVHTYFVRWYLLQIINCIMALQHIDCKSPDVGTMSTGKGPLLNYYSG